MTLRAMQLEWRAGICSGMRQQYFSNDLAGDDVLVVVHFGRENT
jgi:hypothetical protein